MLKQGIFSKRLGKVNQYVDEAFASASQIFLNDLILLKNYKQQIKDERSVKGKALLSMKQSLFENHWKFIKAVKNHDGTDITKEGYLMDDGYVKRERQLKHLEQKLVHKMNQRAHSLKLRSGPTSEEEDSYGPEGGDRKRELNRSSQHLQIVHEQEHDLNSESSFFAKPQQALKKLKIAPGSLFKNTLGQSSFYDTQSGLNTPAHGTIKQTQEPDGTESDTGGTNKFVSFARQYSKDEEIRHKLVVIEKDLFKEQQTEQQLTKHLQHHDLLLNPQQRGFLDKYHSSINLKTANSVKLAQKFQQKLLKDVHQQVEHRILKERLRKAMIEEQNAYKREQEIQTNKDLQESIQNFLMEIKKDSSIVQYVLDLEANESDEDFNIFDAKAKNIEMDDMYRVLKGFFTTKVVEAKQKIIKKEMKSKLLNMIKQNSLQALLARGESVADREPAAPVPKVLNEREKKQREFERRLSKNYYDDKLKLNQAPATHQLSLQIQREIAQLSN